jgi:murein L,D-transpeptidase YcbB/YkuD
MFPNPHHVYIHDTPSKGLFTRTDRTFSSGCIRIEKPVELATFLLNGQDDWNREKIEKVITTGGNPLTVHLERYVPVHILYLTAWGVKGKAVQFRKDVYERDKAIEMALSAGPPEL